ncbi:MAG: hypothetical protein LCH96_15135 [Actinobacteria bacterium]|nr:hypothetical protein [Actinomycetota bacterium]
MELQRLRIPTLGVSVDAAGCDVNDLVFCAAVQVRVGGDESWGSLVARAVESEWMGVEALAGEAGSVADATRVNASRCGQAVADTVASVRTWDRKLDAQRTFAAVDCGFGPGGSQFQERLADGTWRYAILDVDFLFTQGSWTAPVQDAGLAAALEIEPGTRVRLADVRDLALRGRP